MYFSNIVCGAFYARSEPVSVTGSRKKTNGHTGGKDRKILFSKVISRKKEELKGCNMSDLLDDFFSVGVGKKKGQKEPVYNRKQALFVPFLRETETI